MGRFLAIAAALLIGLFGLFMTICGGGFAVVSIGESRYRTFDPSILVIALPVLGVGLACIWGCVAVFRTVARQQRDKAAPPAPPAQPGDRGGPSPPGSP